MSDETAPIGDQRLARLEQERAAAAATLRRIDEGWAFYEQLGYQPRIETTEQRRQEASRVLALFDELIAEARRR